MTYIRTGLLIALLVLTQTLLLIHTSVHVLDTDSTTTCELCLAADHLNSSLISDHFHALAAPLTHYVVPFVSTPYLRTFKASSPLPRAPPFC